MSQLPLIVVSCSRFSLKIVFKDYNLKETKAGVKQWGHCRAGAVRATKAKLHQDAKEIAKVNNKSDFQKGS